MSTEPTLHKEESLALKKSKKGRGRWLNNNSLSEPLTILRAPHPPEIWSPLLASWDERTEHQTSASKEDHWRMECGTFWPPCESADFNKAFDSLHNILVSMLVKQGLDDTVMWIHN